MTRARDKTAGGKSYISFAAQNSHKN